MLGKILGKIPDRELGKPFARHGAGRTHGPA